MEDVDRLTAVREAIGPTIDLMVDANQSFTFAEAKRRAHLFEPLNLFWFEEPMPAEDMSGHVELSRSTSMPIAVGESIYSLSHFREYLAAGACGIVQVDVARIGGITPWLKTAHLAESFNVKVAPHFLMELHVSLAAAVPNALYVEHIPQLDPPHHPWHGDRRWPRGRPVRARPRHRLGLRRDRELSGGIALSGIARADSVLRSGLGGRYFAPL